MTLKYRDPAKLAARRAATPDKLSRTDALMATLGAAVVRRFTDYPNPYGPPVYRAPSPAVCDYFSRKRESIINTYFRQRYGRDYWTGAARHPNRVSAEAI